MKTENKISAPESQAHTDLGITDKDKVNGIVESQAHLLTEKDAGVIALKIAEKLNPKLNANEEAFFIAGFQEAIKYNSQLASQPPVMEGKEEISFYEFIKDGNQWNTIADIFDNMSADEIIEEVENYANQKTSSLQSEVEQLKGLLKECNNYFEDERAIIEQAMNTDNYACIPDNDLKLIYNQVSNYLSK